MEHNHFAKAPYTSPSAKEARAKCIPYAPIPSGIKWAAPHHISLPGEVTGGGKGPTPTEITTLPFPSGPS